MKGYPPPTVTWRKLAGVFPKNRVSSFNNSMTLRAATRNDAGAYECQATNRLGQASAVTTVIVWPPPKLTTKPVKSAVELPGRNLSLNCFVSDQNTISWRRIGGTWEDKRTKIQNGTLTIYNLKTSDSGSYICEAKSLFYHIEEKTVLQVKGGGGVGEGGNKVHYGRCANGVIPNCKTLTFKTGLSAKTFL